MKARRVPMSHRRTSRARALLRRLMRAQLRLKVMASVVVVTLVALVAFDVGAVTTMRRYLLAQTDNNLQVALTLTTPRLNAILSGTTLPGRPGGPHAAPVQFQAPPTSEYPALPGAGASLDQVTRTIDQVEVIVTFGSIAVVLLIGLGVFVVLRRGLRPIEAMAGQADRITAGDLTDRVTPQSPRSEVGRLGAALNGMLARIEAGVREREASQQQMRRFFADASHELRTPLASLRANAELYQQGALCSPDEVDEVMDRIVLETRRMGRLVDDMLRLARLGQHPGQSSEPVDVTAVVTGCADRVRVADPARTWRGGGADGLTTVGDEELLRRAVDNLLINVLAHTPADTAGIITASAAGGRVTIEVSDDGHGVPPDELPHIFERFFRAGAHPASASPASASPASASPASASPASQLPPPPQPRPPPCPGPGLGLAIAAEIASAPGGPAQATPASPHGLRIALTLPVRRPSAPRSARELAAAIG